MADDVAGVERKPVRRIEHGRLAFYIRAADAGFWDEQWERIVPEGFYAYAEREGLGWFEEAFSCHLSKTGRILEAGCGLGQYVLALRTRGYETEGMDWAQETITAIKGRFPDLPVGDATAIEAPDNTYQGYISLGVVEHRYDGPEPFLREALRVLAAGGIIIITVSYLNALRRFKALLGWYSGHVEGREFDQYAFSGAEFTRLLKQAGFEVVTSWGYDSYKGLVDEPPLLRAVSQRQLGCYDVGAVLQRMLALSRFFENTLGHMQLVVCRKPVR
jgi:SAM-dependent methyltransferase